MKAATILAAIEAMKDMDSVRYDTPPKVWARKANDLLYACNALEAELKRELPDVKVERESQQ